MKLAHESNVGSSITDIALQSNKAEQSTLEVCSRNTKLKELASAASDPPYHLH